MPIDPRQLKPSELCRLLNSTPLGEVINERQLHRHRTRAGFRIGDGKHVDLVRYVAWLVQARHAPKPETDGSSAATADLAAAAQGAAAIASSSEQGTGHGQKLNHKQEALIAALLTERTYAAAAEKAGVSESTLYRWLRQPGFRGAYRRARRELVETAIGRIQAGTGQAVESLLAVARHGKRDSDRVRAAIALLNHAFRGLSDADLLHGEPQVDEDPSSPADTTDVVRILGAQLQQIDHSDLPTGEKARLTAALADALLRAIGVDLLDNRTEAIQAVLLDRKDKGR